MQERIYKIFTINLGSTSTKVCVWHNNTWIAGESLNHPKHELEQFHSLVEQYEYRLTAITGFLHQHRLDYDDFDILVSRGGNVHPVPGGIYVITEEMLTDMFSGKYGVHPNCCGNKVIYEMGKKYGIPAIFVDPPVTDEFCDEARMTGLPEITRQSSGHALNQKSTARKIAQCLGSSYEQLNFIVCHLGGGISVGAHRQGKIIDMNNALDGDGPMAPERAGSLPTGYLIDMSYSGNFTHTAMRKKITGRGGWVAHLGTADGKEVLARISKGDVAAQKVLSATLYQLAKEIAAMAAVLQGQVAGIGITGSLAHAPYIVEQIKERTAFLNIPYFVYAGENEMEALCEGALRFLRNEEVPSPY